MTETQELEKLEVISEAVALIDRGLGDMLKRELVSTDEVADLLLDVRTVLAPSPSSKATSENDADDAAEAAGGDESAAEGDDEPSPPHTIPSSN